MSQHVRYISICSICTNLLFAREPARIFHSLLSFIAFCIERGPMEQARSLLNRAMALAVELLEKAPPIVAELLRYEARFRSSISDEVGAEEALLSARDLLAESPNDGGFRESIEDDLLIIWLRHGKKGAEVDDLLDRAIESDTRNLRLEDTAAVQHLADLLSYRRQWQRAEELYRKALEKQKETIGEWDPRYALTLSNLGSLLRMRGRCEEAAPLFRKAAEIRKLEFGEHHQSVVNARLRLALALGGMGQWEEAMTEMEQVVRANELFLQSAAAVTSREQLFRTLSAERLAMDVFISIALHSDDQVRARRVIYEATLRRKGLAAEALAARRLPLLSERYPRQGAALTELDRISSLVSEHLVSSRHSEGDLREARARKRQLEMELAMDIPEMRFESVWRSADADGIRRNLEDHCLLLEYAQFRPFNFEGTVADGAQEFNPPRYLGFVLAKDAEIAMKDLGDAAKIDQLVTDFGRFLAGEAGSLRHFATGADTDERKSPSELETVKLAGKRLREAIWDPLCVAASGIKQVLVAPDGLIGLVPFDLLPIHDGQLLLDAFLVSNIGSGRDIIRLSDRSSVVSTEPVIFCAPNFDVMDTRKPAAVPQRDFIRSINRSGITRILPLPGAEREGHEIHQLLPGSRLYSGAFATESAMRNLRSPLVLHIATHGFSMLSKADGEDGETMFNAGLIFAGANVALVDTPNEIVAGDAVLTGEEAGTLNLMGTQLVVLSACRSGLGKAVPGEGVFGLHRAFSSAGARCVITSLWKIPDEQTTDLMKCFYQALRRGYSRASALREAKRCMRAIHPHPFFWGSFICHGDWREIPALCVLGDGPER